MFQLSTVSLFKGLPTHESTEQVFDKFTELGEKWYLKSDQIHINCYS